MKPNSDWLGTKWTQKRKNKGACNSGLSQKFITSFHFKRGKNVNVWGFSLLRTGLRKLMVMDNLHNLTY